MNSNKVQIKEYEWLLAHPEIEVEYAGQYVAIVGESVVAHGQDFAAVLEKAERFGEPFIHKVPRADRDLVV